MKIFTVPATDDFPFDLLKQQSYDLLEIRLDYASDPLEFLKRTESILPLDPKTIITLRDRSEGGINHYPLEKKTALYNRLIKRYDCMVDFELELFIKHDPGLPYKNLFLSKHFGKECPDIHQQILSSINQANNYSVKYLKIVMPVVSYSQLQNLPKYNEISDNHTILCGTDVLGKLSRILWNYFGSSGTFVSFPGFKTAEEQLTPDEFDLYSCGQIDSNSYLGGIIGGEQVYYSLGLKYYNQRLRQLNDKVVYLPFPVSDTKDFLSWLRDINISNKFYGFSVTMPCKQTLPEYFGIKSRPVNLLSFDNNNAGQPFEVRQDMFYNTDKDAFKKALDILDITKDDSILVFGNGATALCFIEDFGSGRNLTISGRNGEKAGMIAEEYEIGFVEAAALKSKHYDLIINCTPIGMNDEDFYKTTRLAAPSKMIDLPYTSGNTPAVQYCLKHNIPHIDGKKFWLMQARKQEEVFSENIALLE